MQNGYNFQKKIVIIDNDFVIRQVIKSFLVRVFKNVELYSSENGVEGLGLVISTNPDLVIIDVTLPKYSGRELIEYLVSNPRFNDMTVIVLNDGAKHLDLPDEYIKLDKKDPYFLHKLIKSVGIRLKLDDLGEGFADKLRLYFGSRAIKLADRAGKAIEKAEGARIPKKIYLYAKWIVEQIITSVYMTGVRLLLGKGDEANVEQKVLDISSFRVRYYPTLTGILGTLFIMFLQVVLFMVGGITIFNMRIESIFGKGGKDVEINLADSRYDPEEIEVVNGEVRLKVIEEAVAPPIEEEPEVPDVPEEGTSEPEPELPEEDNKKEEEDLVDQEKEEVLGLEDTRDEESNELIARYSTDNPLVTFNQGVEYSTLLSIVEESSINSFETSVPQDENFTASWSSNTITYQLSPDSINWYFYNVQEGWKTATQNWMSSNTIQEVNTHLGSFNEAAGGDLLYLRAFLHSDGSTQISLKRLVVKRDIDLITPISEGSGVEEEPSVAFVSSDIIGEMEPIVLNAGYSNGEKVIAGRVELPAGQAIANDEVENYKVNVYYTNSRNKDVSAVDKGELIGNSDLFKVSIYGTFQYVYELRTPSVAGGYVTAEVVYEPVGAEDLQRSRLSNPVENSTVTVTETGVQDDATLGDGNCDHDVVTPGSQCTLRAAGQETDALAGQDNIYFDIPDTDPGCISYGDDGNPGGASGTRVYYPYNQTVTTVNTSNAIVGCLSGSADPDIKWWRINMSNYALLQDDTGVIVDASTQPGASCDPLMPKIELRGTDWTSSYLLVPFNNNSIYRGFVLNNGRYGFYVSATNVTFHCNISGLNVTGTQAASNRYYSMYLSGGGGHTIGGSTPSERNVMASDYEGNIDMHSSSNNVIYGNYFNTDITGEVSIPSFYSRTIRLRSDSNNNAIGGSINVSVDGACTGQCNLFDGTIEFPDDNRVDDTVIQGNFFELNKEGNRRMSNSFGVTIKSANNTLIGGYNSSERNLFAGRYGVEMNGQNYSGNIINNTNIIGNYFGLDTTGSYSIGDPNMWVGIRLEKNSINTLIEKNVFGGYIGSVSTTRGVAIITGHEVVNTRITDNLFGTDKTGTISLPNARNIVFNASADGSTIDNNILLNATYKGVIFDGATNINFYENTVSNNTGNGIYINTNINYTPPRDSYSINISRNSIYNNGGLGIDINEDGLTSNDYQDTDTGPNNRQNYPALLFHHIVGSNTQIYGSFNSLPSTNFRLEFFSNLSADSTGFGEGENYLGFVNVATDASGDYNFLLPPITLSGIVPPAGHDFITATATVCTDATCTAYTDTSEFSRAVGTISGLVVNSTGDGSDTSAGDGICFTGNTNSEGDPECSLRAAMEEANALGGMNSISFDIPDSDPIHKCYRDDGVAGQITLGNAVVTTVQDDPTCGGTSIDPDHPYSWFDLSSTGTYTLTGETVIDGYTQAGSSKNTVNMGEILNHVIKIDTSDASFNIDGGNSEITGIVMSDGGASINLNSAGNHIYGIFMGVDMSGLNSTGSNHRITINKENSILGSNLDSIEDNSEINIINAAYNTILVAINDDEADNIEINRNYLNTGRTGKESSGNFRSRDVIMFSGPCTGVLDGIKIQENLIVNNKRGVSHGYLGGAYCDYTFTNFEIRKNRFGTDWNETISMNHHREGNIVNGHAIILGRGSGASYTGTLQVIIEDNIIKNYNWIDMGNPPGGLVLSTVKKGTIIRRNRIQNHMTWVSINGSYYTGDGSVEIYDNVFDTMMSGGLAVNYVTDSLIANNAFTNVCYSDLQINVHPYYAIFYANLHLYQVRNSIIRGNHIGVDENSHITNNKCIRGIYVRISPSSTWPSHSNIFGGDSYSDANIISGITDHYGYPAYAIHDSSSDPNYSNTYSHNLIGVDPEGNRVGDVENGIFSESKPVLRNNVVAGHTNHGIWLEGTLTISSTPVEIEGNCIGTAIDCQTPLSSSGGGIFINRDINGINISNNTIANLQSSMYGGVTLGNHNISDITIHDNKIYNTQALPVNIEAGTEDSYGVTENDEGDTDTGPNEIQNYPVITEVEYLGNSQYRIYGDLDENSSESPFTIEICESDGHESGHGGCLQTLGTVQASSPWVADVTVPGSDGLDGRTFSVLATNANGSTSEFGTYSEEFEGIEIIDYFIELVFPIDGIEIDDTTPQLDWNTNNPEVDFYAIFMDGVYYATSLGPGTEYQTTEPLSYDTHAWEVVAYRGDPYGSYYETGRSAVETFTIVPPTYTFELVYPVDIVIDDTTPLFDWTPSEGLGLASTDDILYEIYIDGVSIAGGISYENSEYQLPDELALEEGIHTWFVVAYYLDIDGDLVEVGRTEVGEFEVRLPRVPEAEIPETGEKEEKVSIQEKVIRIVINLGRIGMEGLKIVFAPLSVLLAFPWLIKKREKNPWGIVFHKDSKAPIAFAVVRLFQEGKLLQEKVSDLEGRYGFNVSEGKYEVEVKHSLYKEFRKIIHLKLEEEGRFNKDLPLIRLEAERFDLRRWAKDILSKGRESFPAISRVIFIVGGILAIVTTLLSPNVWNAIVLIFYGVVGVVYVIAYMKLHKGKVYDSETRKGVVGAFVRVFDPKKNKMTDTQITDKNGRYIFIIEAGTYNVLITKEGYQFPSKKEDKEIKKSYYGSLVEVKVKKGEVLGEDFWVDPVEVEDEIQKDERKRSLESPFA